ncbi:hypothetical protein CL673_09720 [Candidatus Bathyarchaeota archaeon]|nr:hypothetical protein [Candidatus Bathyarchaeota archaeon]
MKTPPRYQFCEVPNNPIGHFFVLLVRAFVNRDRYKVRVRGQHLRKGENWRLYQAGQPINKSTHLRIYLDDQYGDS